MGVLIASLYNTLWCVLNSLKFIKLLLFINFLSDGVRLQWTWIGFVSSDMLDICEVAGLIFISILHMLIPVL